MNDPFESNRWKSFYKVAATTALLIVLVGVVDIVLSMLGGEAKANNVVTVTEWFMLFQTNRIAALSNLGLINIITLTLGIPIYLALYNVHRHDNPAFAALSPVLFFIGTAIYISSNTVFSMLALSTQYATATDAQKILLEAAGRAALAQGADLTPGTFMGFFFTQTAGIVITMVMLRGGVFSKWTAWIGLLGFGCMFVFFILAAFAPALYAAALMLAMFGGLLLMAYHIMIARKLFQLGQVNEEGAK